jgi:thymidylate synthase (FAD)
VRTDRDKYFANLLNSGHGSVLEHSNFGFIFHHVSRVFTHELVRHRAGSAFSQESLRFVRLENIPFWLPEWVKNDPKLRDMAVSYIKRAEEFQAQLTEHLLLDDATFQEKKQNTSFMRRFLPEGVATDIEWTANVRTIRHVLEARTDLAAEEEIRLVMHQVGEIMVQEVPLLFQDFWTDYARQWKPKNSKV